MDPVGNNVSILLVEDDPANQFGTKSILEHFGYQVDVAGDGQVALEMLEEKDFDLIIMDCSMPNMDGYETTVNIRDQKTNLRNHLIPIIALTAHAQNESREKCLAVGMNDYLSKPVNMNELLRFINKWTVSNSSDG